MKDNVITFTQSKVPFVQDKTIGIFKDSEDKIWFHGPDVARLLDYDRPMNMYRMVDDENKGTHIVSGVNNGKNQECVSLTEAGFYQVAMLSRTETGKKLMTFVCSELLPSIRRTGGYISDNMSVEQLSHFIEDQIIEKCINVKKGKHVRIGNLVKTLMNQNDIATMKKKVLPYINQKLTESNVKGVKDVFFQRTSEAIEGWIEDNAKLTGKAFDVTEHVSAIMLLKDFTDNKCNYIQTSKGQTVRRMRERTNKILQQSN